MEYKEIKDSIDSQSYKVNKLIRTLLQSSLSSCDVTVDQWLVMRKLYNTSRDYNQKELAEACYKEKAAMTRMIDSMQKKKYVERCDSKLDRREYLINITDEGKEAYLKSEALISKARKDIEGILSSQENKVLLELMKKLEDGLSIIVENKKSEA